MGKYFGTDGFRGEANCNLTADHAFKVGRFLGWYYTQLKRRSGSDGPARIVIGKDTRRSSYMFEYSLVGGLVASGADAYLLHVTTTPSVAFVVRTEGFDCGIMISASHNPYYDNGIKLINSFGEKMDESVITLVEAYLDGELEAFGHKWEELPLAKRDQIGRTVDHVSGRNRYIGYLISLGMYSFKGIKVGLDCANGASWNIAKSVLTRWVPRPTSSMLSPTATTSTPTPAPPILRCCSAMSSTTVWMLASPTTATQTAACAWTKRATSSPATIFSISTAST